MLQVVQVGRERSVSTGGSQFSARVGEQSGQFIVSDTRVSREYLRLLPEVAAQLATLVACCARSIPVAVRVACSLSV